MGETEERSSPQQGRASAKPQQRLRLRGLPWSRCVVGGLLIRVGSPQATHSCRPRAQESSRNHAVGTGPGLDLATQGPLTVRQEGSGAAQAGSCLSSAPRKLRLGMTDNPELPGGRECPWVRERNAGSLVAWTCGAAVRGAEESHSPILNPSPRLGNSVTSTASPHSSSFSLSCLKRGGTRDRPDQDRAWPPSARAVGTRWPAAAVSRVASVTAAVVDFSVSCGGGLWWHQAERPAVSLRVTQTACFLAGGESDLLAPCLSFPSCKTGRLRSLTRGGF